MKQSRSLKRGSEVHDSTEASGLKKREAKRLMKESSQQDQSFNFKNIVSNMEDRATSFFNI